MWACGVLLYALLKASWPGCFFPPHAMVCCIPWEACGVGPFCITVTQLRDVLLP